MLVLKLQWNLQLINYHGPFDISSTPTQIHQVDLTTIDIDDISGWNR